MKFIDDLQKQIYYHGQIDYCYFMLQEMSKHQGEMQHPLIAMIDEASGFNKEKVKEEIKDAKYLINTIIKCKEKIGYDVTEDKKFLTAIIKL